MREKLRNFYSKDEGYAAVSTDKEGFRKKLKTFISEATELSKEHDLPRPLEYYTSVFETAFDFIKDDPTRIDTLNFEYVTFSE